MSVAPFDVETLRTVGPVEIAAYLRSHAWKQVENIGDKASVWTKQAEEGGEYEILLPLDRTLSEFARRLSEALQTLSVAEQRPETAVLHDITTAAFDVVRVRLQHALIENGTVPLDYGVQMIQQTRELMLAAACATVRPRALYQSRKPQEALDYVDGLRMGQTESGSFVLAVQSPVPPLLRHETLFPDLPELRAREPFERRVLLTLTDALAAVRRAILSAGTLGDVQPFQEAIPLGVSANLCDALVGLSMENTAEEVALQISWSPTRRIDNSIPNHFRFGRDAIPVLREVSRLLREASPIEDFQLFGTITRLRREDRAATGNATVAGWVENGWRKVRMELSDRDYQIAVRAHQEKELVQCVGELVKQRRTYSLLNVQDFTLLDFPATDLPDEEEPFTDEYAA